MSVEQITLETITLLSVTNKEDNQTAEEVWPQLKSKFISIDIQIFNIPSERTVLGLEDLPMSISLTSEWKKREMLLHGQDIMLNHNSVSMVMPLTSKTLASVTELFGSVEEKMNRVIELLLGTNSECGHLFQKLMKLLTLDAINTLLEMLQV